MFKIQFIEFQTEFEILLISGTYLTSCNSLTTDAWPVELLVPGQILERIRDSKQIYGL